MLCRRCKEKQCNRPRGLCWTCYYTPGVKDEYEITTVKGIYGSMGHKSTKHRAAPCEPTGALPGTPEKIAVLEQRAALGQELWHPLDPNILPAQSTREAA